MPPPLLPQEILDTIIDHIAEPQLNLGLSVEAPPELQLNLETLKACSLVSHAFAYRVQPYIFALLKVATDAELTDEGKKRRIERRVALTRLLREKPHIDRGVHGVSIDLIRKDAYDRLFQLSADHDDRLDDELCSALEKLQNVKFLQVNGGPRQTGNAGWSPFLMIHKLPFNFTTISSLSIRENNIDYAVLAFMPLLSYISLSGVRFIPSGELLDCKELPKINQLFIREFDLFNCSGDMLDVITDNIRGTGPQQYPILDFSRIRSLRLGVHQIIEGHYDEYLSSLWRLLGYCARSVEILDVSSPHLFEYDITKPFVPVGSNEASTLSLRNMHQLHSLTLRVRPIDLISRTGHDAVRDVIHLLDSLPTDNKISSLTIILHITSEEELAFGQLMPYVDWDGLFACMNRMTSGRKLAVLDFIVTWRFMREDPSLFSREYMADVLLRGLFRGLGENILRSLDQEPLKAHFIVHWE